MLCTVIFQKKKNGMSKGVTVIVSRKERIPGECNSNRSRSDKSLDHAMTGERVLEVLQKNTCIEERLWDRKGIRLVAELVPEIEQMTKIEFEVLCNHTLDD